MEDARSNFVLFDVSYRHHKDLMTHRSTQSAFSLVELSIVLVILGLLVGGVLSGQSLIHAAELRVISVESQKYIAATQAFRDKYFALPGDLTNATKFWGSAGGTGSDYTCFTIISSTPATCNGDGNGKIDDVGGVRYEDGSYWKHLANAGLIEGSYSGSWWSPSYYDFLPSSRFQNGLWYVQFVDWVSPDGTIPPNSDTGLFGGNYRNTLSLMGAGWLAAPLTPVDAWNVDKKMDDGAPGTGRFIVSKGSSTSDCTSAGGQMSDAGATYNVGINTNLCWPMLLDVF